MKIQIILFGILAASILCMGFTAIYYEKQIDQCSDYYQEILKEYEQPKIEPKLNFTIRIPKSFYSQTS